MKTLKVTIEGRVNTGKTTLAALIKTQLEGRCATVTVDDQDHHQVDQLIEDPQLLDQCLNAITSVHVEVKQV